MLEYYSPDGVHVVQGYVLYIPAVIALVITIALGFPAIRRKIFSTRKWLGRGIFSLAILGTAFLWLYTLATATFATHVTDYIRRGTDLAQIQKLTEQRIGFSLPPNCMIDMFIGYGGWQTDTVVLGIIGGTKELSKKAQAHNFNRSDQPSTSNVIILSPIKAWQESKHFRADTSYHLMERREAVSIYIDKERDIAFITISHV